MCAAAHLLLLQLLRLHLLWLLPVCAADSHRGWCLSAAAASAAWSEMKRATCSDTAGTSAVRSADQQLRSVIENQPSPNAQHAVRLPASGLWNDSSAERLLRKLFPQMIIKVSSYLIWNLLRVNTSTLPVCFVGRVNKLLWISIQLFIEQWRKTWLIAFIKSVCDSTISLLFVDLDKLHTVLVCSTLALDPNLIGSEIIKGVRVCSHHVINWSKVKVCETI